MVGQKKQKNKVEAAIQKELVKWMRQEYPKIDIRYNKGEGDKNLIEAIDDKRMGLAEAGTPDLTLFMDKGEYTYIFELELKRKKGKLNEAQKEWWSEFKPNKNKQGQIAYGLFDAQDKIKNWVDLIN